MRALVIRNLLHVPGGTLLMGSEDFYVEESPVLPVEVQDVWVQPMLVTNAEFSDFVTSTGYVTTAEREDRQRPV